MMVREIKIDTDFIKLDSLLKYASLVGTGGEAKILIQEGHVLVNGEVERRRGRKIHKGDLVDLEGQIIEVI